MVLWCDREVKLVCTPSIHFLASSSLNTDRCFSPHDFSNSARKNFCVASPISRTLPSCTQSSASRSQRSSICPGVRLAASVRKRGCQKQMENITRWAKYQKKKKKKKELKLTCLLIGLLLCTKDRLSGDLEGMKETPDMSSFHCIHLETQEGAVGISAH